MGFIDGITESILEALFDFFQFFATLLDSLFGWLNDLIVVVVEAILIQIIDYLGMDFQTAINADVWTDVLPYIRFIQLVYPFVSILTIYVASVQVVASIRLVRWVLGLVPTIEG